MTFKHVKMIICFFLDLEVIAPLGTSNVGKSKRVRLHQLHRRNKTINPKFISYQYLEIIFTEVFFEH